MNKRIGFSLFALIATAAFGSMGCVSSATQARMADLQNNLKEDDHKLTELGGQLAAAKAETAGSSFVRASGDALSSAAAAWHWASGEVSSSYHAVEATAHKCYDDGTKLDTAQDYQALALRCWNEASK